MLSENDREARMLDLRVKISVDENPVNPFEDGAVFSFSLYEPDWADVVFKMEDGNGGWVYIEKDAVDREWPSLRSLDKDSQQKFLKEAARQEIAVYQEYVAGNVYVVACEKWEPSEREFVAFENSSGIYSRGQAVKVAEEMAKKHGCQICVEHGLEGIFS